MVGEAQYLDTRGESQGRDFKAPPRTFAGITYVSCRLSPGVDLPGAHSRAGDGVVADPRVMDERLNDPAVRGHALGEEVLHNSQWQGTPSRFLRVVPPYPPLVPALDQIVILHQGRVLLGELTKGHAGLSHGNPPRIPNRHATAAVVYE